MSDVELFESLERVLPPLSSASQLAELSGLGASTLAEWRAMNIGPSFVKVGRRVMYPKEAVLDYLREHTHHTARAE